MSDTSYSSQTGAVETVTVGSEKIVFRTTSEESAGALVSLDVRMPPGGGPPALHRHHPSELYRVESGELVFYVEQEGGTIERTVHTAGAVVAIAGGREHTVRNESRDEAHAFVVFAPGAEMESFARAAGALAATGRANIGELLRVAAAHGIEITRRIEEAA
jgi:mannose-6-phosphate isomerase-like protein (cupin superfamily)